MKTIDGKDYDLKQLKGKKVIVINVASKCGLTPQYESLQKIYEKLDKSKFEIIAFPANNFLRQESGTNEEIVVKDIRTLKGKTVNYLSLIIMHNPHRQRVEIMRGCRKKITD